jgi:PncC family amidohydrolase
MLDGLLKAGETDYGIAVSGIAGPGGGTPDKPVGTVYVGIAGKDWKQVLRCNFDGDRRTVRNSTVLKALQMLVQRLQQ